MTDSIFRLKKTRDSSGKQKSEILGTLDSIHQNVLNALKESHSKKDELIQEIKETQELIEETKDITTLAKLHNELREKQYQLKEDDPLNGYFLKNADLMLKYYSTILV